MDEQLKNDIRHILAAIGVNMAIAALSYNLTQEQANNSRDNVQKHIRVDDPKDGWLRIFIDYRSMIFEPHLRMAAPAAMNSSRFRATVDEMFARSTNPIINSLKPEITFSPF